MRIPTEKLMCFFKTSNYLIRRLIQRSILVMVFIAMLWLIAIAIVELVVPAVLLVALLMLASWVGPTSPKKVSQANLIPKKLFVPSAELLQRLIKKGNH